MYKENIADCKHGVSKRMATHKCNNMYDQNSDGDTDMCEATYLIIDSTSTQYVNFDDKHMKHERHSHEPNIDDDTDKLTKTSHDIVKALNTMELMDSETNSAIINKAIQEKAQVTNCNINDNMVTTTDENKNQKAKGTHNLKSQFIPPASSRWVKTLNKAQEVLDQGTDIPADAIAKYLNEKHSHETYVESLCKITDTNSLLLKEIDGIMQVTTRNGILQVPMDHFHSYKHIDNGVQCLLCDIMFPENDAYVHQYEVCHMNHAVKVIDHRGMRKIDYMYSHCITCNLKVKKRKGTAAHMKTGAHIEGRKLYIKRKVRKVDASGTATGGKEKDNLMMDVGC